MNGFKVKYFTGRKNQSGATLVIIIIALVVLAVIGLAIYSLTSTALLNQVAAQKMAQAIYLAESGIRVAASEYKHSAIKDTTLVNLNTRTFSLPNGGNFAVNVYPYWFYLPASSSVIANNTTPITLYLPGAVPPIDDAGTTAITFPANATAPGLLKYKNGTTVGSFSAAAIGTFNAASGGTPVTFTLSHAFPHAINLGDEFYLGYVYNLTATAPVPVAGGNLTLADPGNTAQIFPPHKGSIFAVQVDSIYQYSYDLRDTSTANTITLTNMQCIGTAPSPFLDMSTTSNTAIYIGKSLGIRSTAIYGN